MFLQSKVYQVAVVEYFVNVFVHLIVIHCHEEGVDDNAQCDEELHEGIKDNEGDQFLDTYPAPAAVPDTENVDKLEAAGNATLLYGRVVVAGDRGRHVLQGPCCGGVLGDVAEIILSRFRLLIPSQLGPFCRKVVYGNYNEGLIKSIHYFYGHKITNEKE